MRSKDKIFQIIAIRYTLCVKGLKMEGRWPLFERIQAPLRKKVVVNTTTL